MLSAAANWAAVTEPLFTQKLGPKVALNDAESHSSSRRMSLTFPESADAAGAVRTSEAAAAGPHREGCDGTADG